MPTVTGKSGKPLTRSKSRPGRSFSGMRWKTRRVTAAISHSRSTSAWMWKSLPCRSRVDRYSRRSAYAMTTENATRGGSVAHGAAVGALVAAGDVAAAGQAPDQLAAPERAIRLGYLD